MPVNTGSKILSSHVSPPITSGTDNSKRVTFSTIDIKQFEQQMNSHSACSYGPALGLGWNCLDSKSISVDDYETIRPSEYRRNSQEMLIPISLRESILKEIGYSRKQIEECSRRTRISTQHKKNTVKKSLSLSLRRCVSKLPSRTLSIRSICSKAA